MFIEVDSSAAIVVWGKANVAVIRSGQKCQSDEFQGFPVILETVHVHFCHVIHD